MLQSVTNLQSFTVLFALMNGYVLSVFFLGPRNCNVCHFYLKYGLLHPQHVESYCVLSLVLSSPLLLKKFRFLIEVVANWEEGKTGIAYSLSI